ncbi:hypothetical protein N9156_00445 [Akkermansiaceae bacterium]|nr:hypothetical protein [Akkermansiaceae bacterium]MDB4467056.1 inositol monophosphatase [bacterium]MDC0311139.1 hypothetical protein [Akkermansiaceae bacterium]
MNHNEILPAVSLLQHVGGEIARWRTDESARFMHSEAEFKTEADQRAHDAICKGLEKLFPGVPILSEEGKDITAERPDVYWLIDPIDGTASWYGGFPGFVTQAALIQEGHPIVGIVHAPVLERTWKGVLGGGAFCNDSALPRLVPHSRCLVVDNYPTPKRAAATLMKQIPGASYLESGSLGLKCCLVVDGAADLFVKDVIVRDWDIAPAAVMLREVGGVLLLADGSEYCFTGVMAKTGGIVVARDAEIAKMALSVLNEDEI